MSIKCLACTLFRVKRLREDGTRSSSQSRQSAQEASQRSSTTASRSQSRDQQHSRNQSRSTADRSSTLRTSRPYAAGLAAQLSQRRKQLEARAKEKLKMEQQVVMKSPAADSEGIKVEKHSNSPSVKEKNKGKVVIEIRDDDEKDVVESQKEASVDLPTAIPDMSVKADDTSLKTDVSTGTTCSDGTPVSSSDTSSSTAQSDSSKSDAGQPLEGAAANMDSCVAKSAYATVSLMNLPMPPIASESDSEASPVSTEERQR